LKSTHRPEGCLAHNGAKQCRAVRLKVVSQVNLKGCLVLIVALLAVQTLVAQKLVPDRSAQVQASIPAIDRTRLAEAFRLGDSLGERLWPGWTKAPFAVLLVTPDNEFLVRHPKPSADFVNLGYDDALKSNVYYRKRNFPANFLATFPAIAGSGISVIVVGQAENTLAKTSTPWVITVLHEHFHQLQDSQPNFYADVNGLNLAHGDQSGMWMLNYAFPYDRKEVQDQFVTMSKILGEAAQLGKSQRAERVKKVNEYLEARRKFGTLVAPDDDKYLAFQFWKEGIARYTEYHAAQLAARSFRPSKEFRALKDFQSFAVVAETTRQRNFPQLSTQKLGESKREVVYSFGAAEGLLLDAIKPGWRREYFKTKFDLRMLFPPTAKGLQTRGSSRRISRVLRQI
jgi:hypothetical protein